MADFVLKRQNLTRMDENYRILRGVNLKYVGAAGLSDALDQPICVLAMNLGINVIYLTHEMGDARSVGEVLDTRSRADSILALRSIV